MAESKSLEHLEKLFFEAYKRECDQEENLYRSLPFFMAALALAMTILGMAVQAFFPSAVSLLKLNPYVFLEMVVVFLFVILAMFNVIVKLLSAVRPCTYIQPPS